MVIWSCITKRCLNHGTAITVDGKIYLIGGRNASGQNINQVLCFDPSSNQWNAMANMPTARYSAKLVWFENRIWAIRWCKQMVNCKNSKLESYDPKLILGRLSLSKQKQEILACLGCKWKIYVVGGYTNGFKEMIEVL